MSIHPADAPALTDVDELFRKIVAEYGQMGGGYLSLTPMVGDVLLDRELLPRLASAAQNCELVIGFRLASDAPQEQLGQ